jgi:hypothetical protein
MALFQGFWHGPELPTFVKACIASFIDHGHQYHVYAYSNFDLLPGAKLLDAAQILPESEVFFYKNPDGSNRSVAGFANRFRYELLARNGGWWVDTDVLCLTPAVPDDICYFGWQNSARVGNAILKMPPGHPIMIEAAQRARDAGTDLGFAQTGPPMFTDILREMGVLEHASPRAAAYPTTFDEYLLPTMAEECCHMIERTRACPFLHLWHEKFRFSGDRSINRPEPGSFLAQKYAEHRVEV